MSASSGSFAADGSNYQRVQTPGLPAWWRESTQSWERHSSIDGAELRAAGEVSACGPGGELPDARGCLEVVTAAGHPTLPAGRAIAPAVEEAWRLVQAGTATIGSNRPRTFVNLTSGEYAAVSDLYGA